MGRSGSPSRRKSSKKKRSKISSEARRRKRTREIKSKKLRRRDDSASSHSSDDSVNSVSSSSSESEDYCRNRRGRSRPPSDLKSGKRKARKRSYRRESSEDSLSVRKRKRTKRKNGYKLTDKPHKKVRIDFSSSSSYTSTGSSSCSTCEESEFECPGSRSRAIRRGNRDMGGKSKGSRHRSPSCSPFSKRSDSECNLNNDILVSEVKMHDKLVGENNARRLKSVVTVATQQQEKEETKWSKHELKEEIICNADDYPPCRSNDSNDVGSKRYLASHKGRVDNMTEEQTFVSITSGKEGEGQYNNIVTQSDGAGRNNSKDAKEIEVSSDSPVSDAADLELILRQKALENLKKFRGGLQMSAKTRQNEKTVDDVKQLPNANFNFFHVNSPKKDNTLAFGVTQIGDQSSSSIAKRDSNPHPMIDGKTLDVKENAKQFEVNKQSTTPDLPGEASASGHPQTKDHTSTSSGFDMSERNKSALRECVANNLKERTLSQGSPKADLLVSKGKLDRSENKMSQTIGQTTINNQGYNTVNSCEPTASESSSSIKFASGGNSSKEQQDETKGSSQFEQKTMSVMRGGELVQVSYKVYIPKKTPALARRQLRR